ncbi:type II toxin-antitoxin system RelE/ParE family toxin [Zhihengliuella salsuginis]|uniref:Toxin n=1 Tax=Zhihengliuella salsuginis TaxID=578222 RepID=A0ABQ3GJ35_9MICC|nr:type II toxin-antitoxin system RelE/ParE family toxin [Zhihengliuella salsuginis]GHD06408.1 toxin ParE1 [Zhihengliuella salsuginis]
MTRYRLSPAAQADLSKIWDYTEEQWDARQAETYIRDLQTALERIAVEPSLARPADEIRAGYLRYAIGSHLIFFLEQVDHIDVIRVLHQKMDPTRHL